MSNNLQPDLHNNLHLTTLAQANVGTKYIITHCAIAPPLGVRLAELGIVRNTALVVVKTAPTGDPLAIKLRGYMLCLRAETAKLITVAEYDDEADGATITTRTKCAARITRAERTAQRAHTKRTAQGANITNGE